MIRFTRKMQEAHEEGFKEGLKQGREKVYQARYADWEKRKAAAAAKGIPFDEPPLGGIVHDSEWFKRFMQEEFMQESKTYQYLYNKILTEAAIKHILAILESRFQTEAVDALKPSLQDITDLQRLEELLLATAQVQSLDAFAQMLHEQEQSE